MNIYINFEYILSLLDQLTQQISNKVILIDYLKNIGATISNCLGSINNITPVIDDDTNTIKFIDQNPLYNRTSVLTSFSLPTVPGIFDLYGYSPNKYEQSGSAGFIKEFTMKTELTSQFASMISTGAAARSKVVGEDATALSRLNAGLESSLLETITDPNLDYNTSSSLETQYPDAVTNYYNFIKSMNMFPSKPKWNEADFDIYTSVLNTFINYVQQSNYIKDKKATTSTGFIPINVSLRMFGMSGMKIYQEFTLNTDYLPSNYEREMSWLIKGVTHTIENNSWTTTIESLSIPKTVTKPLEEDFKVTKIISENKPAASVVAGDAADYWSLIAIIAAENFIDNVQGMADVAQSIYNRFNVKNKPYGSTIKAIVSSGGQYEPVSKNQNDWNSITSKDTAITAYQNSKNVSRAVAEKAINNAITAQRAPNLRQNAANFIGSRTEFLASTPTSKLAVGIVEREPKNINNVFYWRYAGKNYYLNEIKNPKATPIPEKLINPNFV